MVTAVRCACPRKAQRFSRSPYDGPLAERRGVRHPHVTVTVQDVGLAQAVRLVAGGLEHLVAVLQGRGAGQIRIDVVDAQLEAAATQGRNPRPRQQRMRVIGVIGVHHPLVLTVAQYGQVGICVDDRQAEHVARECSRASGVPHEHVDSQTAQRPPVVWRRHPRVPLPLLHCSPG